MPLPESETERPALRKLGDSVINAGEIDRAVALLLAGGVVGLPTETVYGLAADGTNPEAIRRVFALKGRPADHPLILHLGDASWLGRFTSDVPEIALRLAGAFWPGPLTLVLKRNQSVPDEVTGGRETVAVRVPQHPVALALLQKLGRPLAAPSANRFGEVSPTTRQHVVGDFGDEVPLVLEGGPSDVGLESTIVDLTREVPRILRPGGVTVAELEAVLKGPVFSDDGRGPAAPGTLEAHYAPRAELLLPAADEWEATVKRLISQGRSVGVFAPIHPRTEGGSVHFRQMGDLNQTAHDLYDALRELDALGCDVIVAPMVEENGIGQAVADRMRRASVGSRRSTSS